MSKSRLEKFLYALYSLDPSDLPTPLSRIEELYKCLVTGDEAPTFEPLSRVEKYLMAILGVYDVSELPNPISRVEVLLYKLAIGDDNIDDVKSFLSEHEELLAEIIRNGGVGGNIDIEYVLYSLSTEHNTLYNTAEKPVKSAVLKGQTLVNLHKIENYTGVGVVLDGGINQHFGKDTTYSTWRTFDISMLKPNTEYGVFCWVLENTISENYWDGHNYHSSDTVFNQSTELRFSAGEIGLKFAKLTTISDFTGKTCGLRHLINANTPSTEYVKFRCVLMEYQEGMENWDIPYFDGMQSVKMPVLMTSNQRFTIVPYEIFENSTNSNNGGYTRLDFQTTFTDVMCYIKLNIDMKIKIIIDGFAEINNNSGLSKGVEYSKKINTISYIAFYNWNDVASGVGKSRILEMLKNGDLEIIFTKEGEKNYPYYSNNTKTNILTVNKEVELGSVGDVKDELNVLTGEIIERTSQGILNGTETWTPVSNSDRFYTRVNTLKKSETYNNLIIADKIRVEVGHNYDSFMNSPTNAMTGFTGITSYPNENWIYLKIIGIENVESLKAYLQQNPINYSYVLGEEIIKTVDLSVVDQDGNNTELSTFNDITHVTITSEGLIPEAELEVATKNEEVLNTMSLEMDDISATQTTLEETSNTQSENVDSTMIATTEIYEELL